MDFDGERAGLIVGGNMGATDEWFADQGPGLGFRDQMTTH